MIVAACSCYAQEIHIYSEFERFDPFGNPVASDRDLAPREILSPAMPRNGHLSLHVVITGPAGSNYLLYTGTNPPGILRVNLYREYFTPCGDDYCPDWLAEQALAHIRRDPRIPSRSGASRHGPANDALLPARHLGAAGYAAAPRARRGVAEDGHLAGSADRSTHFSSDRLASTAPDAELTRVEDVASIGSAFQRHRPTFNCSAISARLPVEMPRQMLRVRDIIQRNAAEDMLLARSSHRLPAPFPELNCLSWWPFVYPGAGCGMVSQSSRFSVPVWRPGLVSGI